MLGQSGSGTGALEWSEISLRELPVWLQVIGKVLSEQTKGIKAGKKRGTR